jgi:HD-like signal output (HDOD) protein
MPAFVDWLLELVRGAPATPLAAVRVPTAQPPRAQEQTSPAPLASPSTRATRSANVDSEPLTVVLVDWEEDLLLQIEQRVTQARYSLPEMHADHVLLMNMVNNPSIEMRELAEAVTRDPILTGRVLEISNSARYAASFPAETPQEAILRIGLRGTRSVIFAASMRSARFKSKDLQEFADGVWRQSYSMGCIAREIGPLCGIGAERAFVVGLLHDVGKVALLALLRECVPQGKRANLALVGRVFGRWHEIAGARLAREWKLPADLESVIRCHHDFKRNESEPRLAALASLVHKLDLQLSLSAEREFRALAQGLEMDVLGLQEEQRLLALRRAREAFDEANQQRVDEPNAALPAPVATSGAARSVA